MFKIKKSLKVSAIVEGETVSGMNALDVPIGTYLKVVSESIFNQGDIIIRCDSDEHPFRIVELAGRINRYERVGAKWGNQIQSYKFVIMYGYKPSDFPEYQAVISQEH